MGGRVGGWEGGRVHGREEVRAYWTRQWATFSAAVEPMAFAERADGSVEVTVRQVVCDEAGNEASDRVLRHVYTFQGDLVQRMDIED